MPNNILLGPAKPQRTEKKELMAGFVGMGTNFALANISELASHLIALDSQQESFQRCSNTA